MKKVVQTLKWLSRAWPIWAILGLVLFNLWAYHVFQYDRAMIHKVAGAVLQVLGGCVVLYSLNENMGVFKQAKFFQRIWNWFKSFPLIKRNITLQLQGVVCEMSVSSPTLRLVRGNMTLDEKVEELKQRVEECFAKVERTDKELREKIDSASKDLIAKLAEKGKAIEDLKLRLTATVVGNVNPQLFGLLLVFYGLVLPFVK